MRLRLDKLARLGNVLCMGSEHYYLQDTYELTSNAMIWYWWASTFVFGPDTGR